MYNVVCRFSGYCSVTFFRKNTLMDVFSPPARLSVLRQYLFIYFVNLLISLLSF